jgi:hypothetical protein
MSIKLSVIDNILLQVQVATDAFIVWLRLQEMHETSNKGRLLTLKVIVFIKMEGNSILKHYLN